MVRGGHERPNTHAYGLPINELFRVLTGSHAIDRETLSGGHKRQLREARDSHETFENVPQEGEDGGGDE